MAAEVWEVAGPALATSPAQYIHVCVIYCTWRLLLVPRDMAWRAPQRALAMLLLERRPIDTSLLSTSIGGFVDRNRLSGRKAGAISSCWP